MKKTIAFLLALLMILALSACGARHSEASPPESGEAPVATEAPKSAEGSAPAEPIASEPAEEDAAVNDSTSSEFPTISEELPASPNAGTVDVDLTQLSSTMVYSEVYAMVYEPEQYMGKTVKMNGTFSSFEGTTGQMYYACIVQDATACCAQGLEFELIDSNGYPEPGTEITVVGTFDTYQEEYNAFCGARRQPVRCPTAARRRQQQRSFCGEIYRE